MEQPEKYRQARDLFFQTDLTQAEIARIIGISTRTLFRWMKQDEWKRIRRAARLAPAALVESYYVQLHDLNSAICSRQPGQRFPTYQEAEINRKMVYSLGKLKGQVAQPENIQMMMSFTSFLYKQNPGLAQQVIEYSNDFLIKEAKNCRHAWEMEYECDDEEPTLTDPASPAPPAPSQPAPPPVDPIIAANTFEVHYEPMVKADDLKALPAESGVYIVCEAFERDNNILICSEHYVADADNIRSAATKLMATFTCKMQPRGHTSLYIRYAKIASPHRAQITHAIIRGSSLPQMDIPNEIKTTFPYPDTTLRITGEKPYTHDIIELKHNPASHNGLDISRAYADTNKT